ncbi:MAG: hypothetical protein JST27_10300 [Bacteroidetes bacterium]|nr:hypothetical protein [Bacteroidota bacterium]
MKTKEERAEDKCKALRLAVLQVLQYFAYFRHPLKAHEVWHWCRVACNEEEILVILIELHQSGTVHTSEGHYCLLPEIEDLLKRRQAGNAKAGIDLARAKRIGKFIAQFPFVAFVGISGSLSKGYADEQSDFDYFIVTKAGRLWISRTLLHLLKKLSFLFGQQDKLCMNYFIDETALLLEEQNVYVATELYSMVPVSGLKLYREFIETNNWVHRFLPNYRLVVPGALGNSDSPAKQFFSFLFSCIKPSVLNKWLMQLTDYKWRRKWANRGYPMHDYNEAFKTRLNISKNHHLNYQKKVLEALDKPHDPRQVQHSFPAGQQLNTLAAVFNSTGF